METAVYTEKYPRTFHFPFSEGAQNDDRIQADWRLLLKHELVVTEKLDGENTCIKTNDVFARSHGAVNKNPWAKNMWDIWERVGRDLGELHIFGENLYAIHSIEYERLEHHFFVFAVRDGDQWLDWDNVCAYAQVLELPVVPVLGRGFYTEATLKAAIQAQQSKGSHFGGSSEGIVCRNAGAFSNNEFSQNVLKYVRKNHVQTDAHWTSCWKRAPFWFERPDAAPAT